MEPSVDVIERGLLAELKFGEDRPYAREDFADHRGRSLSALVQCRRHLLAFDDSGVRSGFDRGFIRHVIVPQLLLAAENVVSQIASKIGKIVASSRTRTHRRRLLVFVRARIQNRSETKRHVRRESLGSNRGQTVDESRTRIADRRSSNVRTPTHSVVSIVGRRCRSLVGQLRSNFVGAAAIRRLVLDRRSRKFTRSFRTRRNRRRS